MCRGLIRPLQAADPPLLHTLRVLRTLPAAHLRAHTLLLTCLRCVPPAPPCSYDVPLVADIHFQPQVAMMVADAFEKIRINPGNFVDGRKSFEVGACVCLWEGRLGCLGHAAEVEPVSSALPAGALRCLEAGRSLVRSAVPGAC